MADHPDLDALCAEYLKRLRSCLSSLPATDARHIFDQVSEHIASARESLPVQSEAGVREILERLGTPEDIAATAAAAIGGSAAPPRHRNPVLVGSAALLVLAILGVGLAALLGAFGASGGPSVQNISSGQTTTTMYRSTPVPAGRTVVPNVVGQQVTAALKVLSSDGFNSSSNLPPGPKPVGTVASQQPPAGTRVLRGFSVLLTVSGTRQPVAPAPETVPNVLGQTKAQASASVNAAGLNIRVAVKPDASVAAGTVWSQSPPAGTTVAQQSVVSVTVS